MEKGLNLPSPLAGEPTLIKIVVQRVSYARLEFLSCSAVFLGGQLMHFIVQLILALENIIFFKIRNFIGQLRCNR